MSQKTNIAWTEQTWNPVTGCKKISAGCKICYAELMANRLQKMNIANMANGKKSNGYANGFDVTLQHSRLNEPFDTKKPSMFFVCSMADLFHDAVPFKYIDQVFDVIRANPQHIFQILTKRAERMANYFLSMRNVPKNAWLGVSVENKKDGLLRIEQMKKINAKVRFLSCEPLLEDLGELDLTDIDWVIVGGESGKNARPMNPQWARKIRDQCVDAGVPYFFKQWGEWASENQALEFPTERKFEFHRFADQKRVYKLGTKRAGNVLDGQVWQQMPEANNE